MCNNTKQLNDEDLFLIFQEKLEDIHSNSFSCQYDNRTYYAGKSAIIFEIVNDRISRSFTNYDFYGKGLAVVDGFLYAGLEKLDLKDGSKTKILSLKADERVEEIQWNEDAVFALAYLDKKQMRNRRTERTVPKLVAFQMNESNDYDRMDINEKFGRGYLIKVFNEYSGLKKGNELIILNNSSLEKVKQLDFESNIRSYKIDEVFDKLVVVTEEGDILLISLNDGEVLHKSKIDTTKIDALEFLNTNTICIGSEDGTLKTLSVQNGAYSIKQELDLKAPIVEIHRFNNSDEIVISTSGGIPCIYRYSY